MNEINSFGAGHNSFMKKRVQLNNHKKNIIKSLLLNVCYLVLYSFCFEQFATYDDYTMAVQFASGIGEKYADGQTFINPIYGKIIIFLNNHFPYLPWFIILFTIIVFASLCLVTIDIFDRELGIAGCIIVNLVLLFFSYEGYIGTCFTKVGGIAIVCGLFIIFSGNKLAVTNIIAAILVVVGILLRQDLIIMALGVSVLFGVFKFVYACFLNKKLPLNEILFMSFVVICSLLLYTILPEESIWFPEDKYVEYTKQVEENKIRSRIHDYKMPSYSDYSSEYDSVGVTENDLYIFQGWNFDRFRMTEDIYQVTDILDEQSILSKIFSIENILSFFKEYPRIFLSMDVWYCLLLIIVVILINIDAKSYIGAVILSLYTLLSNLLLMYYLYINGRYNQHRVDVPIELGLILGYIAVSKLFTYTQNSNTKKYTALICMLVLICVPYTYHDDFWWGMTDEQYIDEIKQFDELSSSDKTHFYLQGNKRDQADIFMMYSLWDITKNNYKNKYNNTSMISNFYETRYLREYGISDVYLEAVDSDLIRFVLNIDNGDNEQWEQYFSEITGKTVRLSLIKQCHNKKVYSIKDNMTNIYSKDNKKQEALTDDNGQVDLTVGFNNNELHVKGSAFVKGNNGFTQRAMLYLKVKETGELVEFVLPQFEDENLDDGDEGKYSIIDYSIILGDLSAFEEHAILVLENEGVFYTEEINILVGNELLEF